MSSTSVSVCSNCGRPAHGFAALAAGPEEFPNITAARHTQALLNQMLTRNEIRVGEHAEAAAQALVESGDLERDGRKFRVVRRPQALCRKCYLAASRRLRQQIAARDARGSAAAQGALTRRERALAVAKAKRAREAHVARWQGASRALHLDPPAEAFECPECGRWEDSIHASGRRRVAIIETLGLDVLGLDHLLEAAAESPLRPAYLQRTQGVSYEVAVAQLEAAVRLGIFERSNQGVVPAEPRCGYCYDRRAGSLREPEKPANGRDPLPAQLRFKVLQRDGFRCRYCGRAAPEVRLHIDHVVPVAAGGETVEGNLMTACEDCNLGKSANEVLPIALR